MCNESALLTCTLTTLPVAHSNFAARENFCIADVLSDVDLFVIIWSFIVKAYEAEFRAKNFRKYLRKPQLFLLLCSISRDVEE